MPTMPLRPGSTPIERPISTPRSRMREAGRLEQQRQRMPSHRCHINRHAVSSPVVPPPASTVLMRPAARGRMYRPDTVSVITRAACAVFLAYIARPPSSRCDCTSSRRAWHRNAKLLFCADTCAGTGRREKRIPARRKLNGVSEKLQSNYRRPEEPAKRASRIVILRSPQSGRLEGWPLARPCPLPSFETRLRRSSA